MSSDFVIPPPQQVRDLYRAVPQPTADRGWPTCHVRVEKRRYMDDDTPWETVFEYDRRYAFLRTFEPFRQLRDGVWRDYALISRDYTYFEVVDLERGKVIAKEQADEERVARAQEVKDSYVLGERKDNDSPFAEYCRAHFAEEIALGSWGFCPVEFYVPDWREEWDDDPTPEELEKYPEWRRLTGEWAVYCGCVWGDDSSWKVRYIDLSRIDEGIAPSDDRFGYVELPRKVNLRDAVHYYDETDRLEIAVGVHFSRETGKASRFTRDDINWRGDG